MGNYSSSASGYLKRRWLSTWFASESHPLRAGGRSSTIMVKDLISLDFFVVPTATFRVLFVFLVLAHERRYALHFNVTAHPSAEWTAQQLVEAFPWDTAPRYLLRDRDSIYGEYFRERVTGMGISEVLIAPRSPWQNAYVERLIGSIRRECLDHRHCSERVFFAKDLEFLLRILSALAYASSTGQGCAGIQSCSSPGVGCRRGAAPGRGTSPLLPTTGGLKTDPLAPKYQLISYRLSILRRLVRRLRAPFPPDTDIAHPGRRQ